MIFIEFDQCLTLVWTGFAQFMTVWFWVWYIAQREMEAFAVTKTHKKIYRYSFVCSCEDSDEKTDDDEDEHKGETIDVDLQRQWNSTPWHSGVSRVWQAWHVPWVSLWRGAQTLLGKT